MCKRRSIKLVTRRYFGGFAGGFTGIALVLLGFPMIFVLRKEMPPVESKPMYQSIILWGRKAGLGIKEREVSIHVQTL